MKKLLFLVGLFIPILTMGQGYITVPDFRIYNQVSIGKGDLTSTNAAAWLEIGKPGTNKGFLLPRVNDVTDIVSPVRGLLVFQQSNNTLQYHNGTAWVVLASSAGVFPNLQDVLTEGPIATLAATLSGLTISVPQPAGAGTRDLLTMNTGGVGSADNTKIRYKLRLQAGESSTFGGSNLQLIAYDNSGSTTKVPFEYNRNLGQWVFSDELYIGSVSSDNKVVTYSQRNTAAWNANKLQGNAIGAGTPTNGQVFTWNNSVPQWEAQNLPAFGTVSSVGLSLPSSVFDVTGSPVTGSDVILASFKPQSAYQVFATGSVTGVPVFQGLAAGHIPNLDAAKITTGTFDLARLGTGTPTSSNYLRGDGTWQSVSVTETDPVFGAAAAAGITGTDITNWNNAFGWGNHGSAGYELASNKATSLASANNTTYPTTLAVSNAISAIPSLWSTSGTNIYNSNSGNVGIGTSTPASKLNVNSGHLLVSGGTAPPSAGNGLAMWMSSSNAIIRNRDFSAGAGAFDNDIYIVGEDIFLESQESGTLTLTVSNTTTPGNMGIGGNVDVAGTLGVGTTTPETDVDVRGDIVSSGGPTLTQGRSRLSHGTASGSLYGESYNGSAWVQGDLNFDAANTNVSNNLDVAAILTTDNITSHSGNDVVIYADGAPAGAIGRWTSQGLGIGGMPGGVHTERLFVGGNIVSNDAYVLDAAGIIAEFYLSGATAGVRTTSNHPFTFTTNNIERGRFTAGGDLTIVNKVGINTTTPTSTLHVKGSFAAGIDPTTRTANFTVGDYYTTIVNNGSGAIAVTLPSASSYPDRIIQLKITSNANAVTVDGTNVNMSWAPTPNGPLCIMQSNGTNWVFLQGF